MPSSSARCAQLPRAADKVPYYIALRKLRDYLNGLIPELEESEVVFPDVKGIDNVKLEIKDDPDDPSLMDLDGSLKEEGGPASDQPVKKKRGRPRKIRPEDGSAPPPRAPRNSQPVQLNEDGTPVKKRRGRPPKPKPGPAPPPPPPAPEKSNNVNATTSNITWNGGTPSSGSEACLYSSPGGYSSTVYQGTPPTQDNAFASASGSPAREMCSPANRNMPARAVDSGQTDEMNSNAEESHGLDSPPPPSPSLGPADFSPPATLQRIKSEPDVKQEDEDSGLRRSSSSAEEPPTGLPPMDDSSIKTERSNSSSISAHNTPTPTPDGGQGMMYGNYVPRIKEETPQDMSSKSLSGLVSLVDQIPSIAHMRESATPGANGQVNTDMSGYDLNYPPQMPQQPPHSVGGNFSVSALTQSAPSVSESPFLHRPYATESPHYPAISSSYSVARQMPIASGLMGAPHGYPSHPSTQGFAGSAPAGSMGFPPSPGYSYGQYSSAPPYTHPSSYPYTTTPSLVPGHPYPYPSALPSHPTYQAGYPQNPMGFGSF